MSWSEIGYSTGAIVGGVVLIYLLTRLFLLAFRDKKHSTGSIIVAACIALLLATILAG